jgi:OOP family OmpA-OmpF porin
VTPRQITLACLALTFAGSVAADNCFYIGAAMGSAKLGDTFDGLDVDDTGTAYRIVGGWQLNSHFALEAGWQDFGDFELIEGRSVEVSLGADGYSLGLTGRYPLGERFEVQGRAGAFFWDGEAEINAMSRADPGDAHPYFGAGLGYALSETLVVSGDWTRYDLDATESEVWSVGVQLRF